MMSKLFLKKNTRTPAYYIKNGDVKIIETDHLKTIEGKSRFLKSNTRILYHEESSLVSEMLILQRRTTWFPPKRSPCQTRTFIILSGTLCIAWFDSHAKNVIGVSVLNKEKGRPGVRISENVYHIDFPLTSESLHFETSNRVDSENGTINEFMPLNGSLSRQKIRATVLNFLKIKRRKSGW